MDRLEARHSRRFARECNEVKELREGVGFSTGKAALEELVPKAMTRALENVLKNFKGEVLATSQSMQGKMMQANRARPSKTVRTHKPKPSKVWYKSQAFMIEVDMRDAIPRGDIHNTQHTILLMQLLKTCTDKNKSSFTHY